MVQDENNEILLKRMVSNEFDISYTKRSYIFTKTYKEKKSFFQKVKKIFTSDNNIPFVNTIKYAPKNPFIFHYFAKKSSKAQNIPIYQLAVIRNNNKRTRKIGDMEKEYDRQIYSKFTVVRSISQPEKCLQVHT